jgi:hypothetical protein
MFDKDDAARELAQKHYEIEAGITHILRFTGHADVEILPSEPIKLLEVNQDTVPSGVMPIQFAASPANGIPFTTVIVEVTPDEFDKIQKNELKLPLSWVNSDEIPRKQESVGK